MEKTLPSNGISSRSGGEGGGKEEPEGGREGGRKSEELAARESEWTETQALQPHRPYCVN